MTNLQLGEIVKHLRTGRLFLVKSITKDFVIFNSQEGKAQIMADKDKLHFLFEKIPSAKSSRKDSNSTPKSIVPH